MSEADSDVLYAVVANHDHYRFLREGARCYVAHFTDPDDKRVQVVCAPGGKKWIRLWTRVDRLRDFRVGTVACASGLARSHARLHESREAAEQEVARLQRAAERLREKSASASGHLT